MKEDAPTEVSADRLVNFLLRKGLGGFGPLSSAQDLADEYLIDQDYEDDDQRVAALIKWETRKNFTTGFITGVGGYISLPLGIPSELVASWLIQARMAGRFDATLRKGFDAGALGFGRDGLVVLREPGALELKDRVGMQQAVADDNRDRKAVYKEVAVANGHPEWEPRIREVFAKQWVDSARGGWWYQDAGGGWKQK